MLRGTRQPRSFGPLAKGFWIRIFISDSSNNLGNLVGKLSNAFDFRAVHRRDLLDVAASSLICSSSISQNFTFQDHKYVHLPFLVFYKGAARRLEFETTQESKSHYLDKR